MPCPVTTCCRHRADLLRRLERWPEAATAYREALRLVPPGLSGDSWSVGLHEVEAAG